MKESNGYKICESVDLNPFDDCKPVNCELKYFGKRNFFKSPFCVPATTCGSDPDIIYDYETNSCRSLKHVLSDEEKESIRSGKFKNWICESPEDEQDDDKLSIKFKQTEALKRARRSLNESKTFGDIIISMILLVLKIVSLFLYFVLPKIIDFTELFQIFFIIFIYFMMSLLISTLFYLCISCGIVNGNSIIISHQCERVE